MYVTVIAAEQVHVISISLGRHFILSWFKKIG